MVASSARSGHGIRQISRALFRSQQESGKAKRRRPLPPQPIEPRVTSLERRLTELEQLPARIDDLTSQISQLRTEVRGEFSAVRVGMDGMGGALRMEMAEQGAASAARDEAIGIQMRVLHEDVVSRIGLLQEGMPARPKRRRKAK